MTTKLSATDYAIIITGYESLMDTMDMDALLIFHAKMENDESVDDQIFMGIDDYYQARQRSYKDAPYEASMFDEAYDDLRSDHFTWN